MRVNPLSSANQPVNPRGTESAAAQEFPDILLAKLSQPAAPKNIYPFAAGYEPANAVTDGSNKILLGTISKATPTVYDILHQHHEYAGNWADIVNSEQNRSLPYTTMSYGTDVYLDKQEGRLIFDHSASRRSLIPDAADSSGLSSAALSSEKVDGEPAINENQTENTNPSLLSLGTITEENPTVSHLLQEHKGIKNSWALLDYTVNKNKPFNRIQTGTEISLDRDTGEILWTNKNPNSITLAGNQQTGLTPEQPIPAIPDADAVEKIYSLGKISRQNPTVSHLLTRDSLHASHAWDIIFSDLNKDKPYDLLRPGTEIFLDQLTGELSWAGASTQQATTPSSQAVVPSSPVELPTEQTVAEIPPQQPDDFSSSLVNAVRPYFGKPYKEINCYGLVVRGLSRMGIRYLGPGGVRERLLQMAAAKKMPPNAFFNGEGIIAAAGRKIYSKTFLRVSNVEMDTKQLFDEILPNLHEGDILSFSMHSRGHTGIISRHNDQWTFINSGELDNPVENTRQTKGVGEEALFGEIKNWLQKAHAAKQSLQITLGRLEEEKVRTAMRQNTPNLSSTL